MIRLSPALVIGSVVLVNGALARRPSAREASSVGDMDTSPGT
jgi:hypothetical protein